MTKPRGTFHFNPPISIEGFWTIGLTSLKVINSIFIPEEDNIFERSLLMKRVVVFHMKKSEMRLKNT